MVTFANGTTLDTIAVCGGTTTFQGANRHTLEIRATDDKASFELLKSIYTNPTALSEITVSDSEQQSLQVNFTLPMKLGSEVIDGVNMWVMKLAQKSALELAQEEQLTAINDTQLALIEIADMLAGGEE